MKRNISSEKENRKTFLKTEIKIVERPQPFVKSRDW
jgi:hypothetical protein